MRRFDLYHCLGNEQCARLLQLTKPLPKQRGQTKPGASACQRVLCPDSFRRFLTVNKHCSWAFVHLFMTNRSPRESCLNLFQPEASQRQFSDRVTTTAHADCRASHIRLKCWRFPKAAEGTIFLESCYFYYCPACPDSLKAYLSTIQPHLVISR